MASAYKGLGRLLAATGRPEEAINAYQRSLALHYDQPEVRARIERMEADGHGLTSVPMDDLRTRGASLPGGDISEQADAPIVIVAMHLIDQEEFARAERVCHQWIKLEPTNPLAHRLLAFACQEQGHVQEARDAMNEANRLLRTSSESATARNDASGDDD